MEQLGTDFNATGSVMTKSQLEELRKKRGECVTCGRKCFHKTLFKKIPMNDHGRVLNGRCLSCHPLDIKDTDDGMIPAVSRPATQEEQNRFTRSQSMLVPTQLGHQGPGGRGQRRVSESMSTLSAPLASRSSHSHATSNATSTRTVSRESAHSARTLPARTSSNNSLDSHGSIGTGAGQGQGNSNVSHDAISNETTHSSRSQLSQSRQQQQQPERASSGRVHALSNDTSHSSRSQQPERASSGRVHTAPAAPQRTDSGRLQSAPAAPPSPSQSQQSQSQQQTSQSVQRQSVDQHAHHHSRISGQTNMRSMSGSSFLSLGGMSALTENGDEDYQPELSEEYDDYCPLPLENSNNNAQALSSRPNNNGSEGLQEVLERITGHNIDEDEAFALASVGVSAHPAAVALLDYYRRSFRESQRNLTRSTGSVGGEFGGEGSQHGGEDLPQHGILNRGGAVSFNASDVPLGTGGTGGTTGRRQPSDRSMPDRQTQSLHHHRSQHSSRQQSARSLGSSVSVASFGDDHSHHSNAMNGGRANMPFSHSPQQQDRPRLDSSYGRDQGGLDGSSSHSRGSAMMNHRPLQTHAMTSATLEEPGLGQIRAAGAAPVEILRVMREFPGSPTVQSTGMQELSNLHLSPQDSDSLAQIGAIQVIVETMRSYPADMELQICGCRAMWNMSGTRFNQLAFVEAGALAVILSNMDGYLDVAELQEQALAALGNLGAVEANLEKIVEFGTVRRIVEAMNKHSENVEVQMKGCTSLTNLASHVTPLKKSIMEAGGGGAVVIAMVMHPSNPTLQEKALRAIRNLSAQCEENKMALANIGGIDAVVSAMQVHRDVAGVQEAGAWALSNMAGNGDIKTLIGGCGGIDVIIRAMWVHSDGVSVQEWCCRALYTLSLDRRNSSMVLDVGGISAVVNAMQAHSDSSVVQEMGCAILCNLAVDQKCKIRVVDEEALDAIVLAMVLHGESFKVQECACQVLLQLAIMENFKAMTASNIGELVRTAAEKFPHNCDEPARRLLYILEDFAAGYMG